MTMTTTEDNESALIEISTVARLTGLTTANIRMWEKRYNVVEPSRTASKRRLYTEQDITRLTLLKTLVDRGDPIRTLAPLSNSELENLLSNTKSSEGKSLDVGRSGKCRILAIGYNIVSMFEHGDFDDTDIVAEFDDLESAESSSINQRVDLLVVECPAFFSDTAERIHRILSSTQAIRAIVVYHYAQNRTLEMMSNSLTLVTAIRGPINQSELRLACAADIALANRTGNTAIDNAPPVRKFSEQIPKRTYSEKQLAQISQVSSAIDCECPNHLAGLLTNLISFEKYSKECENRNAADAKMHSYLHQTTAHARAVVEDALKVLVEFENIDVDSELE